MKLFTTNGANRNLNIDFIRGLSILFVVLLHVNILIPFENTLHENHISHEILKVIFHSGYYGVMIFFVVSGFLITSNTLKRWGRLSDIQPIRFYQMRFARIIPCLLLLLFILSFLHLTGAKGFIIKTTSLETAIFSALTFHINWLEAKTGYLPGAWDVLWSLSVEEAFYLFFPLICLLTRKEIIFKLVMMIFIILGPIARYIYRDNDIWSDHSYLSCMDGIAIGCIAALIANKIKNKKILSNILFLFGISLFCFVFLFRHTVYQLGLSNACLNVSFLEIGIGLILVSTANMSRQSKMSFSLPIQWYGRHSYEIYLSHMFVVILFSHMMVFMNHSIMTLLFEYLFIILMTGILGSLIANYFSEPLNIFLRTKNQKFFKSEQVITD